MQCPDKCKHESVKYCIVCNLIHCEECGRTWVDKPVVYPYVNVPYIQLKEQFPSPQPYYGDFKVTCTGE